MNICVVSTRICKTWMEWWYNTLIKEKYGRDWKELELEKVMRVQIMESSEKWTN